VTRAAEEAAVFSFFLGRSGFTPVGVPTIERKWLVIDVAEVLNGPDSPDWIVLTSAAAANVVAAASPKLNPQTRIAAIGSTTAQRAQEVGLPIARIPKVFTRDALIAALGDVQGQHICYPRADLAPSTICDALRAGGARVTDIAYTNNAPPGYAKALNAVLPVDITTLFSGSAARRVVAAVGPESLHKLGVIAAVGPSTARAAADLGLHVGAVATPHTIAGMVEIVRKIIADAS
jgi:uroporphyrinogen-III synthase